VLDVGFSLCTAPTFCHSPDISNISSKGKVQGQGLEFGIRSSSEGAGLEVWSTGVRVRIYLKSYGSRARRFQYMNCRIVSRIIFYLQLFALCKARLHFDSKIKSPSCEHHISLNSGWNHLVFCGPYSDKNKLVHWHQKYAKRNLQKSVF